MIGRAMTRHYRIALGALMLVAALLVGTLRGPRELEAAPIVWYSSVIHVTSAPSSAPGWPARIGTVAVLDGTSQTYVKTTTADTGWTRTDAGAAAAGGFSGQWAAGTFTTGAMVERDPFLFAAASTTSNDPCYSFNSISSNALWQLNGTGATQNVPNDTLTMNANTSGQNATVIYKTTKAGWDRRRLIIDMQISGTADGFQFGILDGALPATTAPTPSGLNGVAGFWGVGFEIYSGGTPGYFVIHNGTQDPIPFADQNSNITNALDSFDRWYLDLVDNGAGAGTVTMTLYRNAYPQNSTNITNRGWSIDQVKIGTWTVTRPTFTNWRFAFGVHTGGSAMSCMVKHAWARDTSGAWTVIGQIPTRI